MVASLVNILASDPARTACTVDRTEQTLAAAAALVAA